MNQAKQTCLILILVSVITIGFFQNCSDVSFSANSDARSVQNTNNPPPTTTPQDPGVSGGHFDLDTSTKVYPLSGGTTNNHVHEYDDKHNTTTADFFNLLDSGFDEVQEIISANEEFYIIVANANLSPMVDLVINGKPVPVLVFQNNLNRVKYSLSGAAGTTKLESFKANVKTDAILNKGLVPTQTGCVRRNDPGANGEYRNGALVIQILRANLISDINPNTQTAASDQSLLWEATLFWHEDGGRCQ